MAPLWSVVAAALCLSACDRFPRDNPIDRGGAGQVTLERGDGSVVVVDDADLGPFNNGNGLAEARETLLLTVPLDVEGASDGLSAAVTVVDLSDRRCVEDLGVRGAGGDQPLMLELPTTALGESSALLFDRIQVRLGETGCRAGASLELGLRLRISESDQMLEVSFSIEISELDGVVSLDAVEIDDTRDGDGDEELDPGETVLLSPALVNEGDAVLRAVELEVAQDGGGCVRAARFGGTANDRLEFDDLVPGRVTDSVGRLEVVVDERCGPGDRLELDFLVRDASEQFWSLPWSRELQGGRDAGAGDAGLP